jgi:hypothetical protein
VDAFLSPYAVGLAQHLSQCVCIISKSAAFHFALGKGTKLIEFMVWFRPRRAVMFMNLTEATYRQQEFNAVQA